jgi:hypothetical protein
MQILSKRAKMEYMRAPATMPRVGNTGIRSRLCNSSSRGPGSLRPEMDSEMVQWTSKSFAVMNF